MDLDVDRQREIERALRERLMDYDLMIESGMFIPDYGWSCVLCTATGRDIYGDAACELCPFGPGEMGCKYGDLEASRNAMLSVDDLYFRWLARLVDIVRVAKWRRDDLERKARENGFEV